MRAFTEKRGPRPKNLNLLHMISENLDLHVGSSEKNGPQHEKCGPLS